MTRRFRILLFATMIAVPVGVALIGPVIADSGPTAAQAPFGPSSWSPFGTDRLGRDVLAAALTGGRTLVLTTGITVVFTYAIGFTLGVIAAATRRAWVEDLVMRPIDVLLCLPSLLIIIVAALHGRGSPAVVAVAVGVASLAPITRFVRMAARSVVHGPVMDALVLQGASWWTRHVTVTARLMARPIAADLGVRTTSMIYILASANFLGLGFDTTSTDWAVAVAANKDALLIAPWAVMLPATLIVSLVLGINLLWDEVLSDPHRTAVRRAILGAQREHQRTLPDASVGAAERQAPGRHDLTPLGPEEASGCLVSLRDVSASVGPIRILSGVDLDIAAGEIVALVGPSGAGKSTLASIVLGEPAPGVTVTGRCRRPEHGRRSIGVVPQHAGDTLNPARRVGTALRELLLRNQPERCRGGRTRQERAVGELLLEAGFLVEEIPGMLRRYPWQFSGGQRQRLALAQVLTLDPELIVLDEPTAGLDPRSRGAVLAQIDLQRRHGRGVLLITHDPDVTDRLGDRVVTMEAGRVVSREAATRAPRREPPGLLPAGDVSQQPSGAAVVSVDQVCVRYGYVVALAGVTLDLHAGEIVGVRGPSGSGKSTLARIVVGLEVPDRGRVLLRGREVGRAEARSRHEKADVQYVWQEAAASFVPHRTVGEQCVDVGVRLTGGVRDRVRADVLELFRSVGLSESQARRLPAGLSGGQLQRVALVRALVSQPSVLVCDEVTTALDTDHAAAVVDRIDAYRRDTGAAVLLISHDEVALARIADRVIDIRDGRVDAGLPVQGPGRAFDVGNSEGRPHVVVPHGPTPSLRKGTT